MDYETKTIKGYYGINSECEIIVAFNDYCAYYVVSGSVNINATADVDALVQGVNIEEIIDVDFITADSPVESEEQLLEEILA